MIRKITYCLCLILFFVSFATAEYPKPITKEQPTGAKSQLLSQIQLLDRDLSRSLIKLESGRKSQQPQPALLLQQYRGDLHQIERNLAKLELNEQRSVRHAVRDIAHKLELLQKSVENKAARARQEKLISHSSKRIPLKKQAGLPGGFLSPAAPPANDACANAIPITEGTYPASNSGATHDGTESCVGSLSGDIWYSYTAATAGIVRASTFGSSIDTVLSVHTPPCPGNESNEIVCNDDCDYDLSSCVSFAAVPGNTYLIRISGFDDNETGPIVLDLQLAGSIEGTITDVGTGEPLQETEVDIFDASGVRPALA